MASLTFAAAAIFCVLLLPEGKRDGDVGWNVQTGHTTSPIRPTGRQNVTLQPIVLGVPILGTTSRQADGTFDLTGYRLLIPGPTLAHLENATTRDVLLRADNTRWWTGMATIPGVAMVLGALFAAAYTHSILEPLLRRAHRRVRGQEVFSMVGVGLVAGTVCVLYAWIVAGKFVQPSTIVLAIALATAAVGLLPFAVVGLRGPKTRPSAT